MAKVLKVPCRSRVIEITWRHFLWRHLKCIFLKTTFSHLPGYCTRVLNLGINLPLSCNWMMCRNAEGACSWPAGFWAACFPRSEHHFDAFRWTMYATCGTFIIAAKIIAKTSSSLISTYIKKKHTVILALILVKYILRVNTETVFFYNMQHTPFSYLNIYISFLPL